MFARDTIHKIKHGSLVVELRIFDNASRVIILTLLVRVCFVRFGVCRLVPKSTCHVMATLA